MANTLKRSYHAKGGDTTDTVLFRTGAPLSAGLTHTINFMISSAVCFWFTETSLFSNHFDESIWLNTVTGAIDLLVELTTGPGLVVFKTIGDSWAEYYRSILASTIYRALTNALTINIRALARANTQIIKSFFNDPVVIAATLSTTIFSTNT